MSRRYPTLEQFEDNQDKIKKKLVENGEMIKLGEDRDISTQVLLEFQKIMTEGIYYLTDQLRDRNFYYYDDKHNKDRWVRVFEHLNLDIAVVVDFYYMFDTEHTIMSFPREMKFYNHSGNNYDLITYHFIPKDAAVDCNTEEYLESLKESLKFGNENILKIVDGMVYAL